MKQSTLIYAAMDGRIANKKKQQIIGSKLGSPAWVSKSD
jgi:hypothetical protein